MTGTDQGNANERTALAWQRTALSLVAGSAAMARITWTTLGPVALAPAGAAVLLALWVIRPRARVRGGRAPFALAVAAVLLAVMELAALLRHDP